MTEDGYGIENLDYLGLPPQMQAKVEEFLRPPPIENGVWTGKRLFLGMQDDKNVVSGSPQTATRKNSLFAPVRLCG